MEKKREEIYIINGDTGQTLYFQSFSDLDHDAMLFAGLLSAILQFAAAYSKEEIGSFSMQKSNINMLRSKNTPLIYLYIVDKVKKKEQKKAEKKIGGILKLLMEKFESTYTYDQIVKWNGDVRRFSDFKEVTDKIINPWNQFKGIF